VRSLLRIKGLSDELKHQYDIIRTQRDALLAAHRQKEELTALIVHDLKNPLSSILSNAQYVLGRPSLGAEERDSLDDVLRASQSMVRLVMNLLDVSRSEDGALVPHVTDFHLPTLLGEVAKEMGRRVEDKDQRIALAVSPAAGTLRGDRDLVRRIVENLIDNAYKYGPRHTTIAIEVLAATMDDGAEAAIEIRVRDEGEGIPAAYRQMIFEKYGRVNGRGSENGRASHGLGLVFCRRAVTVHGGAIWVEDAPTSNMGTLGGSPNPPAKDSAGQSPAPSSRHGGCFCVRLPVARLALSAAPATGAIPAALPSSTRAVG
jgi:signal transduction histidine kinase